MSEDAHDLPTRDEALFSVEQRLRHGDTRGAMRDLLRALEAAPLDPRALEVAGRMTQFLGAAREQEAFTRLRSDPDDPEARYALGYLLVDSGQERLGARYLELCLERVPGEPRVEYELGYARMRAGDLAGAEALLLRAFRSETLADAECFSAGALIVECRVRSGTPSRAREALDALERWSGERDEAQIDALAALVARAERWSESETEGATLSDHRGLAFVLAATMLLHQNRDGSWLSAPGVVSLDYLAGVLRRLERALAVVGAKPTHVTSPVAELRPLVTATARRLGIAANEEAAIGSGALVLLRHPLDAAPHLAALRDAENGSFVFSLGLDPRREHVLTPDAIGSLAERLVLPWEAHIRIGEEDPSGATVLPRVVPRDLESERRLGDELAAAIDDLEGDAEDLAALERYYRPIREHLSSGRTGIHPLRRTMPRLLLANS